MMMMVMVAMLVNFCDDDCCLVMKVILVKEVMSCDISPVAMFSILQSLARQFLIFQGNHSFRDAQEGAKEFDILLQLEIIIPYTDDSNTFWSKVASASCGERRRRTVR